MKRLAILLLLLSTALYAEETAFKVKIRNISDMKILSRLCSIECADRDGNLIVYIDESEIGRIQPYVAVLEKVIPSIPSDAKMIATREEFVSSWNGYPTFGVYKEIMNRFVADYPGWCRIDTIGYSVNGKPLLFMNIHGIYRNTPKPKVMYTSSIHGNELTGFVLMLRYIDKLLSLYTTKSVEGARITRLIDSADIWIMPLMNPDGAYRTSDENALNSLRSNANGYDLNRSFPEQFTDPINSIVGRPKETAAMMSFVFDKTFTLSANFHDGTVVVNYPWDALPDGSSDGTESICPDNDWFINLSNIYAKTNPDFLNSTDFPGGITNGSAWYTVYGGRQDWIYSFEHCRETTIELSDNGILSPDELLRQWTINQESFTAYLEQVLYGFSGFVHDNSGLVPCPLKADIKILEIPSADVVSDSATGYYTRLVLPGTYNIVASAPGYVSDTLHNAVLYDKERIFHDFELKKIPNSVDEISPVRRILAEYWSGKLLIGGLNDYNFDISVSDILGRNIFASANLLSGQNISKNEISGQNMPDLYMFDHEIEIGNQIPGVYFAEIRTAHGASIVKFAVFE